MIVMKKIILAVMAVAAIGFTSCNNKTAKGDPAIDSTSLVETASDAELASIDADNLTKELSEKIEANNAEAVQASIQKAKDKIADYLAQGDAEAARIYQETVNKFLTENVENIKTVVGENNEAVTSLIAAIAAVPGQTVDAVEGTVDAVKEGADAAVKAAKEDAQKKVDEAVDAQKKKAAEAVDAQKKKAAEAVDAQKKAGEAIDNAAADAKKKLGL